MNQSIQGTMNQSIQGTMNQSIQGTMNQSINFLYQPGIPDYVIRVFGLIGLGGINQFLCMFGCVTNIINMVVFYKIGLDTTINLSFFALAVSDFGALLVFMPKIVFLCLNFYEEDLPFEPTEVSYLALSWPNMIFNRVTILLTAFISFEKCLCVTSPFLVKAILTRTRLVVLILVFYVLALGSALPIYYTNRLATKFYPNFNRTRVGLVFTDNREEVEAILSPIANVSFGLLPFAFICLCTVVLVVSLKRQTRWREQAVRGDNTANNSRKDFKVCKMVVFVSALFIGCFMPSIVGNIIMLSKTEFKVFTGNFQNIGIIYGTVAMILQSTNSSLNIFIYKRFSSKYQDMFNQMFRLKRDE